MGSKLFKEYDDCPLCQSFILKPENLPNIVKHLKDFHSQSDISLFVYSRKLDIRNTFLELYDLISPYKEPGFDRDLKRAFHDKSWEMITCRSLLRSNRSVKTNSTQAGPDMTTTEAYIECINVGPVKGYTSMINKSGEVVFQRVPETDIQLRITSAFDKKSKIISEYLTKHVIKPEKARIIAINYSRAHDFAWADNDGLSDNFVLRSLFSMGPEQVTFSNRGSQSSYESKVSFQPEIIKNKNTKIPTNFFLNCKHSHISAVIYSNHQIESNDSFDVSIVNNPFADVPIDLSDYTDMNQVTASFENGTLRRVSRNIK